MIILSEQQEAENLAKYLGLKKYDFTHIPNETGSSPEAKRRAVRMMRAGTSRGFPDYLIFGRGKRIAIELKSLSGKASPEQIAWLKVLSAFGFECAVAHGCAEAIEFVESVVGKEVVEI